MVFCKDCSAPVLAPSTSPDTCYDCLSAQPTHQFRTCTACGKYCDSPAGSLCTDCNHNQQSYETLNARIRYQYELPMSAVQQGHAYHHRRRGDGINREQYQISNEAMRRRAVNATNAVIAAQQAAATSPALAGRPMQKPRLEAPALKQDQILCKLAEWYQYGTTKKIGMTAWEHKFAGDTPWHQVLATLKSTAVEKAHKQGMVVTADKISFTAANNNADLDPDASRPEMSIFAVWNAHRTAGLYIKPSHQTGLKQFHFKGPAVDVSNTTAAAAPSTSGRKRTRATTALESDEDENQQVIPARKRAFKTQAFKTQAFGTQASNVVPITFTEMAATINENDEVQDLPAQHGIRGFIDFEACAHEGQTKEVFRGLQLRLPSQPGERYAAKRFKNVGPDNRFGVHDIEGNGNELRMEMMRQLILRTLVVDFIAKIKAATSIAVPDVDVLIPTLIRIETGPPELLGFHFLKDAWVYGDHVKYSSNVQAGNTSCDELDQGPISYAAICDAFPHFCLNEAGLVAVDVQGIVATVPVGGTTRQRLSLFDMMIHSGEQGAYGAGDEGEKGVERFQKQHLSKGQSVRAMNGCALGQEQQRCTRISHEDGMCNLMEPALPTVSVSAATRWWTRAKEKWLGGDVPGARSRHTESEAIWLAAAQL
ncbi:hypothetical protein AURDEDRAFT_128963 [Auricularia subglabra TFB-10046 SS5]|nr:hypothetical protein AURDEDRAFT_128963 [Auricularia subglabra TFB-10046 SS5]